MAFRPIYIIVTLYKKQQQHIVWNLRQMENNICLWKQNKFSFDSDHGVSLKIYFIRKIISEKNNLDTFAPTQLLLSFGPSLTNNQCRLYVYKLCIYCIVYTQLGVPVQFYELKMQCFFEVQIICIMSYTNYMLG